MIDKFYESFLFRLRDRKKVYITRITNGSIATMEDYKQVIGRLQGLDEAESTAKELFKDMYGEIPYDNLERMPDV